MLWFSLSLLAALSLATADAIVKRFYSHMSAYEMALVRLIFAIPYLGILLIIVPWPKIDGTFFLCAAIALPLETVALLCYMRSIKVSPLSLSLPFLAFTPAFIILSGYIILNERLTLNGIIGICMIVFGAYVLNLSKARLNPLRPFSFIFKEQGSWLMMITAFIYSITATLGKLAIKHSSPSFFAAFYFFCLTIILLSIFPFIKGVRYKNIFYRPFIGMSIGLLVTTMILGHVFAISIVKAAYMISVKRCSVLFGVLYGAILFRETHIHERLIGSLFMVGGVMLIGFLG